MASHTKWANIQHFVGRAARAAPAGGGLGGAHGRTDRGANGAVHANGPVPIRFEGYGPGGAAVLIECVTDDHNRTRAALRQAFNDHGGHLGAEGSVSYLFNHVGLMTYPPGTDEERLMHAALEAGAEDVVANSDRSIEVLADPMEFETVRAILTDRGFVPAASAVTERASLTTLLTGEPAERMVHLLESLEERDDVRNVYSNVEISDEVLARF
ncbi:MAG TPA: YebC/PmpR family DNA-binding transcriptional regulator [Steroidobacteraceae bacterium]|jgi:YebC/PmpR family DNA-binding regulatory protein|nr:YebC/PmpR family DNA-binding transcriptional regulator [Steroidobacteraceae bacterium]